MERRGIQIHWLDYRMDATEKVERVRQLYDDFVGNSVQ
jgi:hypothetical protein